MLKRTLLFVTFIILIIIISGCGGSSNKSDPLNIPVTLNLTGFPYGIGSEYFSHYYMEIYVWKNDTVEKIYRLENVPNNSPFTQKINVGNNSTDISVFLFEPDPLAEPYFFWQFSIKPGVFEHSTAYWLGYYSYFYENNLIRFGISSMLVRNITSNSTSNIDFDDAPYFLFKVNDLDTRNINIKMTASEGSVEVCYNNSIHSVANTRSSSDTYFVTSGQAYNPLYILLRPKNYHETVQASLELDSNKFIDFRLNRMIPSSDPGRVYGISTFTHQLVYIDVFNKKISAAFSLSDGPTGISYSAKDNKLYITHENSHKLTIWDLDNNTGDTMEFTYPKNIKVASELRRIYILTTYYLYIINMDTNEVIKKKFAENYMSMALDEQNQQLFFSRIVSSSYSEFARYSIENDELVFQCEEGFREESPHGLILSPDCSKLLSISNEKILVLNSSDFTQIDGPAIGNISSARLLFSANGNILYCIGDNTLYALDSSDYSLINKVTIPSSRNDWETDFVVNSDDSILVLYCTEFIRPNEYYTICFLDTDDINTPTIAGLMLKSHDISRMFTRTLNSELHRYPKTN